MEFHSNDPSPKNKIQLEQPTANEVRTGQKPRSKNKKKASRGNIQNRIQQVISDSNKKKKNSLESTNEEIPPSQSKTYDTVEPKKRGL